MTAAVAAVILTLAIALVALAGLVVFLVLRHLATVEAHHAAQVSAAQANVAHLTRLAAAGGDVRMAMLLETTVAEAEATVTKAGQPPPEPRLRPVPLTD